MFAGKSQELLRRVDRARRAGRSVTVVGHRLDDRAGPQRLSTHAGASLPARMLSAPEELQALLGEDLPDLLALDEAQFFGPGLVPVLDELLDAGIDVHVAGLCVTYDAGPFAPLPALMASAEEVVKLTAVCVLCGADAVFHERLVGGDDDALAATPGQVGGAESYRAVCRRHHRGRGAGPG